VSVVDDGSEFDDRGFGLCLIGEKHDARGAPLGEVEEEKDEAPVVTEVELGAASFGLAAAFSVETASNCRFGCGGSC
jgi:hypothetical protein